MIDIALYESGSGGEINVKNGDIEMTDSIFNNPYLAHFGGNLEASTTGEETEGVERFDWWANSLMFSQENSQMNSGLERALNSNPLSSFGRSEIEKAANKDIEFMSDLNATAVSVASIIGNDKIRISDKIDKTENSIIWDATKNEIITERTI